MFYNFNRHKQIAADQKDRKPSEKNSPSYFKRAQSKCMLLARRFLNRGSGKLTGLLKLVLVGVLAYSLFLLFDGLTSLYKTPAPDFSNHWQHAKENLTPLSSMANYLDSLESQVIKDSIEQLKDK